MPTSEPVVASTTPSVCGRSLEAFSMLRGAVSCAFTSVVCEKLSASFSSSIVSSTSSNASPSLALSPSRCLAIELYLTEHSRLRRHLIRVSSELKGCVKSSRSSSYASYILEGARSAHIHANRLSRV